MLKRLFYHRRASSSSSKFRTESQRFHHSSYHRFISQSNCCVSHSFQTLCFALVHRYKCICVNRKIRWTDLGFTTITRVSFTSTVSSSLRSVSGSVLQYGYISMSYSSYEITHYEQVVKFDWTVHLLQLRWHGIGASVLILSATLP